jgi:hypothetical protein
VLDRSREEEHVNEQRKMVEAAARGASKGFAALIDRSQLSPLQREHYMPPYERHALEGRGAGLLSHPVCLKCRRWTVSPRGMGWPCGVVVEGPPLLSFGCLTYPGGLTIAAAEAGP